MEATLQVLGCSDLIEAKLWDENADKTSISDFIRELVPETSRTWS